LQSSLQIKRLTPWSPSGGFKRLSGGDPSSSLLLCLLSFSFAYDTFKKERSP
jgi:hypothetical protein